MNNYPMGSGMRNHPRSHSQQNQEGFSRGVSREGDGRAVNDHAIDPSQPSRYQQYTPFGPSNLAPSYQYSNAPQHILQPSYNAQQFPQEHRLVFNSSRSPFAPHSESQPRSYVHGPAPNSNVMPQDMSLQYMHPYHGQTGPLPSMHNASPRHYMGAIPHEGFIQTSEFQPDLSASSSVSPIDTFGKRWQPIAGLAQPPPSGPSLSLTGNQTISPSTDQQRISTAALHSHRNTANSQADNSVAGSRPSTVEGTRFVVENEKTSRGQSRLPSEEPTVPWNDMSQPVSRPGSSSAAVSKDILRSEFCARQSQDSGLEKDAMNPSDLEGKGEQEEKMDHRKRKRNRTIRSCVPCHNHKRKCDRKRPCGRCTALGLTGSCVYEIDEQRDMNDPEVAETDRLRRRIAELELVVRELRQQRGASKAAMPSLPCPDVFTDDDDQDGKKRRVIVDRFARFEFDEAQAAQNSGRLVQLATTTSNQNIVPASVEGTQHQTPDHESIMEHGKTEMVQHSLEHEHGGFQDYKAEP
ncbi:uncharacterized protein L203_103549 [Cryptococcus depauperatus CBS 7841]|uniref:Uncharacterized protein n=1 Tax=Cryptococcus depauperatus CBS 7841 TaxID=1295531 RepID=A0A1E3III1_9TREE|nr:hypothetical protein L203_02854 [Cryptococcus depauperatus CBS 7841]